LLSASLDQLPDLPLDLDQGQSIDPTGNLQSTGSVPAAYLIPTRKVLIPMSHETNSTAENPRVPVMQRVLDNPFLLLFIGVVVPTVFYIIWGIMEIVTIPLAR
jgi:hypothetical protein